MQTALFWRMSMDLETDRVFPNLSIWKRIGLGQPETPFLVASVGPFDKVKTTTIQGLDDGACRLKVDAKEECFRMHLPAPVTVSKKLWSAQDGSDRRRAIRS
jgi:hypothetical protein